jgi:hypothetical protein
MMKAQDGHGTLGYMAAVFASRVLRLVEITEVVSTELT